MHDLKLLRLIRTETDDSGTIGAIYYNNKLICKTLELPDLNNKVSLSCVPAGAYNCRFLTKAGKFSKVYLLDNVTGRTSILIHTGNYAGNKNKKNPVTSAFYKTDSEGCILPCTSIARVNGQIMGQSSALAFNKIKELTDNKRFVLSIENRF